MRSLTDVTADIVSLRRARKARARAEHERRAARNRNAFGRTKAERQRQAHERERAERHLDSHRRADEPDDHNP